MMNVYFTVDTESSLGGAWTYPERRPLTADKLIFCRIAGRDHGIGLIADILSQYGFRATFFVETLRALVNGDDDVKTVFDILLARKQDVQLHIHPTYRFYVESLDALSQQRPYRPPPRNDFLSAFGEEEQMSLIEQAVSYFKRLAGHSPMAFRAGCFAADRATLRCLHRAGMLLDTSFNPCYPRWSFPNDDLQPNQACNVEGIWEIPITVARTPIPEGYGGLKHADPSALSFAELRIMLEHGAKAGQKYFVIVFHSFSAVKPRDGIYSQMTPDRLTVRRLQRLMEYLSSRSDLYRVTTFGDLAREVTDIRLNSVQPPRLPLVAAGIRKSMQALNRLSWF